MDYKKYVNKRADKIKPSGIRKFFDIASKVEGAISLGVGEPDFITPWDIRKEAINSIQKGETQYTSNWGLLELRKLVSKYLESRCETSYSYDDEILVTVGASEAIDLSLRAYLNDGDEVLLPDPSYVAYASCITLSGGVPIPIPCVMEKQFQITAEEVEKLITPKTKAIIVPYPNNPTGAVMSEQELEKLAKIIIKYDLICISDEIYCELTYGYTFKSIVSFEGMRERTILLNGFSKAFAMTGWRVGYLACPKEMMKPILKIHQYCIMCASNMSQHAAIAALNQGFKNDFEEVNKMREEYDVRRKFLVSFCKDVGLDIVEPKGAFYVFPSTRPLNMTGEEFANELLQAEKVAVVPGSAFGLSGDDNIRISYAYSMKSLQEATKRIERFIIRK